MEYNKKELIKNSIDVKYYKFNFWFSLGIFTLYSLPFLFGALATKLYSLLLPILLLFVFFCPMIIYYLYRFVSTIKNASSYDFQAVTLDELHASFLNLIYFTVSIEINGVVVKKDTKAIFNSSPFSKRNIENFNQQKCLVAYREDLSDVIVVKKV